MRIFIETVTLCNNREKVGQAMPDNAPYQKIVLRRLNPTP